jgi:hypothetical protein
VCRPSSLLIGEGGVGGEAKSYEGEKAWSSTLLSGQTGPGYNYDIDYCSIFTDGNKKSKKLVIGEVKRIR